MVKEPQPGRVKTRLGREIGMVPAAWWFRHQTRRLLQRVEDSRWDLVLAVTPDNAGLQSRVWPGHITRWPQGRGNLGDRMRRVMHQARGPVCVVGGDIPGITSRHIWHAFQALATGGAVFGPAPDGGYWLVGLHRANPWPAEFLTGVRWSSAHALADSRASFHGPVALTNTLRDVDTAADLAMTQQGQRDS